MIDHNFVMIAVLYLIRIINNIKCLVKKKISRLVITITAVAIILGMSTINIYAQLDPQPQIIGNKNVEDNIKSLENTSEKK